MDHVDARVALAGNDVQALGVPRSERSVIRDFTSWWFAPPASPWFSVSFDVEMARARRFLDEVNAALVDGPRVSVNHLVVGAIAQGLADTPDANAHLIGGEVYRNPHVGVAMPVNLLGHREGRRRELGIAVVDEAETLSLRELAARSREVVAREREGDVDNAFVRTALEVVERIPRPLMNLGLELLDVAMQRPAVARRLHPLLPVTTGVTNPGSVFTDHEGVVMRGGAMSVPHRLVHVGTVWGMGPVMDGVVAVDGRPEVRPVLPMTLTFDHRLIDGVKAGRLLMKVSAHLRDPAATFGPTGERRPG